MTAHSALTGSDLHEPKGAASATSGAVYVADGSGSGAWTTTPTWSQYTKTAAQFNLNKIYLSFTIPDAGALGVAAHYIAMPRAGTITGLWAVPQAAASSSNTTLTAAISGTNVTNGVITVASTAAAGDVSTATPSALNTVTAGQALRVTSNLGSGTVMPVTITVELTASA